MIQEESYSFLLRKQSKNNSEGKKKGVSGGIVKNVNYPMVIIEQDISDDDDDNDDDGESSNNKDQDNSDFDFVKEEPFSGFAASEYAYGDDDPEVPIINFNESFHWIVLWILLYQERYRLSDVATDSLVKFIRYLLILLDANIYKFFPTSLYMARKKLGICAHVIKYAACEKCCKLYNITEVSTDKPSQAPVLSHCTYIDFSKHLIANKREKCGAKLNKNISITGGIIY